MTRELRRRGRQVGHNRVARLMRQGKLGARRRKAYRVTTKSAHAHPVAENLLQRLFRVGAANRVWASDITYIFEPNTPRVLSRFSGSHPETVLGNYRFLYASFRF